MTLPINVTLPLIPDKITSGDPQQLYEYIKTLIFNLNQQLQTINYAVNGTIKEYTPQFFPMYRFIVGSTTVGVGVSTYINTSMYARRQDLMNENWFDISWTATTETGNLLIQVPFFSMQANQRPYVCVIESNGLVFTAGYTYLVGNLIPNTNTIEIRQCGSGLPSIPLPISATGSLRGSIVYAGQRAR